MNLWPTGKIPSGDAGQLPVFCQSCFKSMLIGQAGGVGGKNRQEVEMMQGEQENSGKEEADSPTPAQITKAAGYELPL